MTNYNLNVYPNVCPLNFYGQRYYGSDDSLFSISNVDRMYNSFYPATAAWVGNDVYNPRIVYMTEDWGSSLPSTVLPTYTYSSGSTVQASPITFTSADTVYYEGIRWYVTETTVSEGPKTGRQFTFKATADASSIACRVCLNGHTQSMKSTYCEHCGQKTVCACMFCGKGFSIPREKTLGAFMEEHTCACGEDYPWAQEHRKTERELRGDFLQEEQQDALKRYQDAYAKEIDRAFNVPPSLLGKHPDPSPPSKPEREPWMSDAEYERQCQRHARLVATTVNTPSTPSTYTQGLLENLTKVLTKDVTPEALAACGCDDCGCDDGDYCTCDALNSFGVVPLAVQNATRLYDCSAPMPSVNQWAGLKELLEEDWTKVQLKEKSSSHSACRCSQEAACTCGAYQVWCTYGAGSRRLPEREPWMSDADYDRYCRERNTV